VLFNKNRRYSKQNSSLLTQLKNKKSSVNGCLNSGNLVINTLKKHTRRHSL